MMRKQLWRYIHADETLMIVDLCNSPKVFLEPLAYLIVLYNCFFFCLKPDTHLRIPLPESHFMEEMVSVFLISYVGSPVLWLFKNLQHRNQFGPQLSNLTSVRSVRMVHQNTKHLCCNYLLRKTTGGVELVHFSSFFCFFPYDWLLDRMLIHMKYFVTSYPVEIEGARSFAWCISLVPSREQIKDKREPRTVKKQWLTIFVKWIYECYVFWGQMCCQTESSQRLLHRIDSNVAFEMKYTHKKTK